VNFSDGTKSGGASVEVGVKVEDADGVWRRFDTKISLEDKAGWGRKQRIFLAYKSFLLLLCSRL